LTNCESAKQRNDESEMRHNAFLISDRISGLNPN